MPPKRFLIINLLTAFLVVGYTIFCLVTSLQSDFTLECIVVTPQSLFNLIEAPECSFTLYLPFLTVVLGCYVLRFVSATARSKFWVTFILLALLIRYLTWRSFSTLDLYSWAGISLGLIFFSVELIELTVFILKRITSIFSISEQSSKEADKLSQDVYSGRYLPSIDVLIPTYNEPEFVVRRTVLGCLSMEYPNKQVYILDDTRRPFIRDLAEKLGCKYITRSNNQYAKAGNLNNALLETNGELIAVLDADFVPFRDFLTRTVGFFQESDIGLVQTPQSFYNPDHYARNLDIDRLVPYDLAYCFEVNYSQRDYLNTATCFGTGYLVRRDTLNQVGGYYTKCVNEDTSTSLRILLQGYRVIYLDEKLAIGESPRTYIDFVKQRVRWHLSDYQITRCKNDLVIWKKLSWFQLPFFIIWYITPFLPLTRAISIFILITCAVLGIKPFAATYNELIFFCLPWLAALIMSFGWFSEYRTTFVWQELYNMLLLYPLLKCQISAFKKPFGQAFNVTRKAVQSSRKAYNFSISYPLLMGAIIISLIIFIKVFSSLTSNQTISGEMLIMVISLGFYAFLMYLAFWSAIDQPENRAVDRFPVQWNCHIKFDSDLKNDSYYKLDDGVTLNLSERGAYISVFNEIAEPLDEIVYLNLSEHDLKIKSKICRVEKNKKRTLLALSFLDLSYCQHQKLIELLYANRTYFRTNTLGSLETLFVLLVSLLNSSLLRNKFFKS
ncbi:MAG: glycosyltransferase [Nostoc sp.]|uniref:glycosyltransferase n=1 Tax=Nostoc sp. TaxID=1180 RepID=UPI002FF5448A